MHEAAMYNLNCFVTLTYAEDQLPPNGSLDRSAFPLFMKKLRREVGKVRYFHVGEYGERHGRPHYHALLFGWAPADGELLARRGEYPVFRSKQLERLWPYGLSEVGSVTERSAGYVARYVRKKFTGEYAVAAYQRDGVPVEPPYATMSRRPGIGAGWIDRFGGEVYREDSVVVQGWKIRPPRYYDNRWLKARPLQAEELVWERESRSHEVDLAAAEKIAEVLDNLEPGGEL